MSMKTRRLLHRSGRNQFGEPGQPPLAPYEPSREESYRDQQMVDRHRALNDAFVTRYGASWLARFGGLSQAETWERIFPHGRPALSTFRSHAREFASFEEFLFFLLLKDKRRSLSALGYSPGEITSAMNQFAECGRYFVSYGKSGRTFCTM